MENLRVFFEYRSLSGIKSIQESATNLPDCVIQAGTLKNDPDFHRDTKNFVKELIIKVFYFELT
jgi:hypothetical protein